MRRFVISSDFRTISFITAMIFAIPGLWKGLQGIHLWLSPFLMLNSVFALKSFVWLNIIAVPVLILIIFKKRWFCKYLCPAGLCFDKMSSLSRRGNMEYNKLPDIGKWLAIISLITALFGFPLFVILDPLALFNGFFLNLAVKPDLMVIISLFIFPLLLVIHFFLPGIWCKKLCPLGGLQTGLLDIKTHLSGLIPGRKQPAKAELPGRRYFLMSGAGLLAGLTVPMILRPSADKVIRPPGTAVPHLFNLICCRCGNCIKACPTNIIIPFTDISQPLSYLTPVISFGSGYCLETCNICGKVCTTGAITLFSVEAKKDLVIGSAMVERQNCYLLNNRECIKCREVCKYNAIVYKHGNDLAGTVPVVDPQKCVGCGACEVVCPAECIIVKPIQPSVYREKHKV